MTYCTQQNMIDRFGEIELIQRTDRASNTAINATVLAQAISDAGAEIDGYLTAYALPLAVVPANLVRLACDIARYYLYDDQVIEVVDKRYKVAIDYLKMVAKGTISIAPDTSGVVIAQSDSAVEFQSSPSAFSRDAQ